MSNILNSQSDIRRNYYSKIPINTLRMRRGDLRILYKLINDKQIEHRDWILNNHIYKLPEETDDGFSLRRNNIINAFITSITVDGSNGEFLHGSGDAFLSDENLPQEIRSVLFSTATSPKTELNFIPNNRITVFLDFTQPPAINFRTMPGLATQNASNYEINADEDSWFTAIKSKLDYFFGERRTGTGWLHEAAVYDLLVFLLGIPLTMWSINYASSIVENKIFTPIFKYAIYIYLFFFGLNIFHLFFSYSRWVFPKTEIDTARSKSPFQHRAVWYVIFLSIVSSFAYDTLKEITK